MWIQELQQRCIRLMVQSNTFDQHLLIIAIEPIPMVLRVLMLFYHIFKDRAHYMIMGQVVLFPPTVRYIFTLFYIEESKYSLKCSVNP